VMDRKLVCISCPLGCRLTVSYRDENHISVKGNKCAKGYSYAREEVLAPRRVVTATVRLESAALLRLPVKTTEPLPKEHIPWLLDQIYAMKVTPPVICGDLLLSNIQNTGVDLVAARSVKERS
jgi:CxxC motif-containing protein